MTRTSSRSPSVLFLAIVLLGLFVTLSQALTLKLSNATLPASPNPVNSTKAPVVEVKPTGTVLERFGSFCGKKSKQCAGYCKNNKGESMDENTLDSFFCYTSKEVAGGNI
jgi:hypothetical protein